MDLINDYALPLPMTIIREFLAVPTSARDKFPDRRVGVEGFGLTAGAASGQTRAQYASYPGSR